MQRVSLPDLSLQMTHDAYPDSRIREILKSVKRIALVGASASEARPSWIVTKYLLDRGYDVIELDRDEVPARPRL